MAPRTSGEYHALHKVAPGMAVDNLVVKVLSEPKPAASPSADSVQEHSSRSSQRADKTFHTALVGDESGSILLVFRSQRKTEVKRNRYLLVTGVVSSFKGVLQIQVGPRSTDLELLKHGVSMEECVAEDSNRLSAVVHHVGVLLIRLQKPDVDHEEGDDEEDEPPYSIGFGVQCDQGSKGRVLYVASALPQFGETFQDAACRAINSASELEGVADLRFCANLPPVTQFHSHEGVAHMYHFYLAQLAHDAVVEDGDERDSSVDDLVWVTYDEARKARKKEKGKHLWPIIKAARAMLESAVESGVLCGPGWDDLRQFLAEPVDEHDHHGHSHEHGDSGELASFFKGVSIKREGRLPVTLLSGFLGSGKTTLMRHILHNQSGWRVAILVNDMAELNIDSALVKKDIKVRVDRLEEERVVALSNGCICCTLREDLLTQIIQLAQSEDFDYLLIESSGISEPLQVAETFTFEDEAGNSLSSLARLDTCVTVVDANAFALNMASCELMVQRAEREGQASGECNEDKTVVELMMEQVEFANVVIINKLDLVPPERLEEIAALVKRLNPDARVVTSRFSAVQLSDVIDTGLFSMEKAQQAPGWLKELRGEHKPESEEYGVSSFVYARERPFHPARLHALVYGQDSRLQSLVRVKGWVWLATRMDIIVFWSLAGTVHSFDSEGDKWLCSTDPVDWPESLNVEEVRRRWQPLYGDRRQEVVLIGVHLQRDVVSAALDSCLLTDEEMLLMPFGWSSFQDPFPVFKTHDHDHKHDDDSTDQDDDDDEEEDGSSEAADVDVCETDGQ